MAKVQDLIDSIGRKKFEEAGFSQQELTRVVNENIMPAGWFPAVRKLCHAAGETVPEDLFRWRNRRKRPASRPEAAE